MALITGAWSDTTLVCGNHPETSTPPVMELQLQSHIPVYRCPKCSILNRDENEPECHNRLSAHEYEKMLDYVATIIADADEDGETPNLTNYKWTRKTMSFKILRHQNSSMIISVLDKASSNR